MQPTTPPVSSPARTGLAPSSREKILDVAEPLFARRGYSGVGLREVARDAGLGKSSLFHHFRGKAQLYLAVLERVFERIEQRIDPSLQAGGDVLARIDRCVDAIIDALAEHPTTARLLLRSLFEDDDLPEQAAGESAVVEARLARLLDRVLALLREGVAVGALRAVSARHTLQTVIGATVFHFASGEFGAGLFGHPLFSADAVRQRKQEVKALLHAGIAAATNLQTGFAAPGAPTGERT